MLVSMKSLHFINILEMYLFFIYLLLLVEPNYQYPKLGYFNVNNKLYCETHARAAKASQQIGQQTAASINAAASASAGNIAPVPNQSNIAPGISQVLMLFS